MISLKLEGEAGSGFWTMGPEWNESKNESTDTFASCDCTFSKSFLASFISLTWRLLVLADWLSMALLYCLNSLYLYVYFVATNMLQVTDIEDTNGTI